MKGTASLKWQNRHLGSHITLSLWGIVVLFPIWTMIVNSFKFKLDILWAMNDVMGQHYGVSGTSGVTAATDRQAA